MSPGEKQSTFTLEPFAARRLCASSVKNTLHSFESLSVQPRGGFTMRAFVASTAADSGGRDAGVVSWEKPPARCAVIGLSGVWEGSSTPSDQSALPEPLSTRRCTESRKTSTCGGQRAPLHHQQDRSQQGGLEA